MPLIITKFLGLPEPCGLADYPSRQCRCAEVLEPSTARRRLGIISPVMAPSITIGATILLCRKPATKVIVFQSPSGTRPINRMPRGARPLRRTRLVLTAVSSINTRRAGSNMPCSRIQRRRARTTSARSCSAALRLFFEGDFVSIEKPPKRTAAGSNSLFAQLGQGLFQGQIRLLGNQSQYPLRKLFQWRNTSATRLWRRAPDLPPALQPSDRRTRTDLETLCRFAPRSPRFHSLDHSLTQVPRIRSRHRPAP